MIAPADVLDFWFGAPGEPDAGAPREFWFRKSEATDVMIAGRFGAAVGDALHGAYDGWAAGRPQDALALILLLDQFTRNIHRDTPQAFAGDAQALRVAAQLVDSGAHVQLAPLERWFAYMPFEHSESLEAQHRSVSLFRSLAAAGLDQPLDWAVRHCEVVERFGRFPHRNEILGRRSTAEELEFLQQPGSRF